MLPELVMGWLEGAIENAPVLAVLALVAYDLRKELRACQQRSQALLERLLAVHVPPTD